MQSTLLRRLPAAVVAALSIAGAAAHAQDVAFAEAGPSTFLDGGVGKTERAAMDRAARAYNLHLLFSERRDRELAAGVDVAVLDGQGRPVFTLADAGPQTDLRLPPGRYRVLASLHGKPREQRVDVPAHGTRDLAFHWRGRPKFDPFDGSPIGGTQIPG